MLFTLLATKGEVVLSNIRVELRNFDAIFVVGLWEGYDLEMGFLRLLHLQSFYLSAHERDHANLRIADSSELFIFVQQVVLNHLIPKLVPG